MRWTSAITISFALALTCAQGASAAADWSTSDRLNDRREVSAGTRAYSIGFQDGRFYANGWHIQGEMGGIWSPPLKLADGIWFGIDDEWVQPATRFTSGRGFSRYELPDAKGLHLRRTDFVPDGRRAAVFGLELSNPSAAARTVTVKVDAHSELLGAYPWSGSEGHPTAADNLKDVAALRDGALVFTDRGALPGAAAHDWAALVGADRAPVSGEVGEGFRGPQPGSICKDGDQVSPAACDDGPHGNGAGGQLRYQVTVPARGSETVWVAVAGSDQGEAAAKLELAAALRDPTAQLRAKRRARNRLAAHSRVDLPGDRALQDAVDAGKQNLADLTQIAQRLRIRFVDQGKKYPTRVADLQRATFIGAGYPDYPWLFATDGEYTAFAAVALGQFEAIKAHLIALRDVSDALNGSSGKIAHEIVTDGSVYFGANTDAGNTDESVKFPSAVALVWRWTGDDRFRDDLYSLSRRSLLYVTDKLDADKDGWPEGLGNVEREGMGEEKLDNAVYLIRGLYDLADMAQSKRDRTTANWALDLARKLRARFHTEWWNQPSLQYADSLDDPGGKQVQQRHWTGVTPMEVELTLPGGVVAPGLAPSEHADAALSERESDCFSGSRPLNTGLFHTGCFGGPKGDGERSIFSLTTSIAAVAEGNYGRSGQRRYTNANVEGLTDEQPGALPEILPSLDFVRNLDRCWTCRGMFMQAWGHYGIAWPVIHQQLGVRPSLGNDRLDIVPRLPGGQTKISGRAIRLGTGTADVSLTRRGSNYTTTVRLTATGASELRIGVTLPPGEGAGSVRLDGKRVKATTRETHQGVEITVGTRARGTHTLTLTTR